MNIKVRISVLVCFNLFGFFVYAQNVVNVSKKLSVSLYFNSEIEELVLGEAVNFLKELDPGDRKVVLRYSALSTNVKDTTNLTVITKDKYIYEFILNLGKRPELFNIRIPVKEAIMNLGQATRVDNASVDGDTLRVVKAPLDNYSTEAILGEDTIVKDSIKEQPEISLYHSNRKEYFRKKIYYHQDDKDVIRGYYARFGKVFLWLENVKYNTNEIYLFFRLENKEGLDYDVGSIAYSIGTMKKKNNSFQRINMPPLYRYHVPKRIKGGSSVRFALVFEKFSLDKNKALVVDFDEENGSRNLELFIKNKYLNEAIRF